MMGSLGAWWSRFRNSRIFPIFFLFSFTLNVFFLFGFFHRSRHEGFHMGYGMAREISKLDRRHFDEIRNKRREIRGKFANLHQSHMRTILSFRKEFIADTPDRERLQELLDQIDGDQARFHGEMLEFFLDFLKKLTPEEREAVLHIMDRFDAKFKEKPRSRGEH